MLVLWSAGFDGFRHLPDLCTVLVEDHIRYLPSRDANDIPSTEGRVVERWFADRLDFEFPVPTLAGARLSGGRLCFIDGQRVGLLFYERGGKRVSVFVMHEARLGGLAQRSDGTWAGGMHGFHVRAIPAHGVTYALVSDLPESDLREMWSEPVGQQ